MPTRVDTDVVAVAPRKVRTMVVKSDGTLVPREDPAPAATAGRAAEPTDPAPQMSPRRRCRCRTDRHRDDRRRPVGRRAGAHAGWQAAAAPKPAAKAQSANTPAKVPVAPQRPSDQPVDVVGEVKPDQVASIDPADGDGWRRGRCRLPRSRRSKQREVDLPGSAAPLWQRACRPHANIVKAEIAGKGTFYRVRVPAAVAQRCHQPVRPATRRPAATASSRARRRSTSSGMAYESRRGQRSRRLFVCRRFSGALRTFGCVRPNDSL